jgi:CheY-like chemotaxis protein
VSSSKQDSPRTKILVADDLRDAAVSLALLLELCGAEVCSAFGGEETVSLAESFRPDVVLLDISMPRLNGYEVARRLRAQPWGREMILLALTGWGGAADLVAAREAGFDGHLLKPAAADHVLTTIARLRAARTTVPAAPAAPAAQ